MIKYGVVLFFILAVFACEHKTNSESASGATYYVIEPIDAVLYENPSRKSKKMDRLIFCDSVSVLERLAKDSISLIICKRDDSQDSTSEQLMLTSSWAKVKYKGKTGYTPSLYLSQLPTFGVLASKYPNISESVYEDAYFTRLNKLYNVSPSRKEVRYEHRINGVLQSQESDIALPDSLYDVETTTTFSYTYKNGLHYKYQDLYVGSGGYTITLSMTGLSLPEALLWCRSFFYEPELEYDSSKNSLFYTKQEDKYTFSQDVEGGSCSGDVSWDKERKEWVVTFSCSGC